MKLGVFASLFNHLPLGEMLAKVTECGLDAVEIGCGWYPKIAHCDYEKLLSSDAALRGYKDEFERRGLTISALSAHGNPLHPDKEIAETSHIRWRAAVELAPKLGVDTVNAFSGCPGDHEGAKYVNWVSNAWPIDMQRILEWQWNEKVVPYWKAEAAYAARKGIHKIAFEMHPGMVVFNNATLFRLREAVGPANGAVCMSAKDCGGTPGCSPVRPVEDALPYSRAFAMSHRGRHHAGSGATGRVDG